jgi:hypothetical protein
VSTFHFTPPSRREVQILEGSLRVGWPVPEVVWKDASGTWQHREVPSEDELIGAQKLLRGEQNVDAGTATELQAAGIGTITVLP